MNTQRHMAWWAGAVLAAVLAGCSGDPTTGYSLESLYRKDVKSVAVPIWDIGQEVYRRELQTRLSEAVAKRIEMDTPYKVTSADRADTELRGKIDLVSQRVLSYSPGTGLPREMEMTFTMVFTWKDLRTGEVLVNQRLVVAQTYITQPPLESDFFQGSEKVINEAARRIVEHLEAPW